MSVVGLVRAEQLDRTGSTRRTWNVAALMREYSRANVAVLRSSNERTRIWTSMNETNGTKKAMRAAAQMGIMLRKEVEVGQRCPGRDRQGGMQAEEGGGRTSCAAGKRFPGTRSRRSAPSTCSSGRYSGGARRG